MVDDISLPSNHGGLVFPLDMFRPTLLAAALAEGLVAQVRNIVDAKLELVRHPEVQLVLARIHGSVVGDDPAAFWRENPELGLLASQVLPRQLFQYWVAGEPDPRQGFMVLQRGQALASQDASRDDLPPGATAEDWPVAQLLAQLQLRPEELADGFAGGPRIEVSLVERDGDDRELLMVLLGQQPGEAEAADAGEPAGAAAGPGQPAGAPTAAGPASGTGASTGRRLNVQDDQKRRAAEAQAEREARQAKAESMHSDLPFAIDDLGLVVAPRGAELADTDILEPYLRSTLEGDLPPGLPRERQDELQGRRIDFAVVVEFFSEVFVGEGPLSRPVFDAQAGTRTLAGAEVRVLEVLAPRLGRGTLIRRGRAGVFVSRTPELELPMALIAELLASQDG